MQIKFPQCIVVANVSGTSKRGREYRFLKLVAPDFGEFTVFVTPDSPVYSTPSIGCTLFDCVFELVVNNRGDLSFQEV